jgi:hypothetical protein
MSITLTSLPVEAGKLGVPGSLDSHRAAARYFRAHTGLDRQVVGLARRLSMPAPLPELDPEPRPVALLRGPSGATTMLFVAPKAAAIGADFDALVLTERELDISRLDVFYPELASRALMVTQPHGNRAGSRRLSAQLFVEDLFSHRIWVQTAVALPGKFDCAETNHFIFGYLIIDSLPLFVKGEVGADKVFALSAAPVVSPHDLVTMQATFEGAVPFGVSPGPNQASTLALHR